MMHKKARDARSAIRNRALHALARMRRGESFTSAARAEHISPRTVRKYAGDQLRDSVGGRIQIAKIDRQLRNMLVPTTQGTTQVVIRGSQQASQLGKYMSAVGKFLRTGDTEPLDEFEGKSISGHALITDTDTLSSLAEQGALQLEDIYAPESSS